jgi:hypothetical protein
MSEINKIEVLYNRRRDNDDFVLATSILDKIADKNVTTQVRFYNDNFVVCLSGRLIRQISAFFIDSDDNFMRLQSVQNIEFIQKYKYCDGSVSYYVLIVV